MNRKFMIFVVVVCAIATYFLFFKKSTSQQIEASETPLTQVKEKSPFDLKYAELLEAYDLLKTALVETDAAKAKNAADNLTQLAEKISIDDIKGDTEGLLHETATSFKNLLIENSKQISQTTDIEAQRVQFENLSENIWALTRTVKYDATTVYLQHCPMAFNDRGANWVSLSANILNPYFGDKMLKCGVVKDSIK